jgi:hypothetical protein
MMSNLPPPQNASMECRRSPSATEPLAATCPMMRPIRLLRTDTAAAQRIGRTKQRPKTGGQTIGSKGQCTIANTAVAESP